MTSDFDIAVVGAGPAGCAAAIWAAKLGLRVVLLEAQAFPRERPGETLHPGVEPLFRQLGVLDDVQKAGFVRFPGNWVGWGREPHFQGFGSSASGSWLGFQASGSKLDSILLRRAESIGVTVWQPCRARAPLLAGARVAGVCGERGCDAPARFTIDGSGRRHWLQRKARLRTIADSPEWIATYGYSRGTFRTPGNCPVLTGTSAGWTWIAPIGEALYAWTRLQFANGTREIPAELSGLEAVGPIRGSDVTWRILERCAGPGYFVCGDAGSVMDPAASHGVLKALMSGILAADLAMRVMHGLISESVAVLVFQNWTERWHARDVKRLSGLYAELNPYSHLRKRSGRSVPSQRELRFGLAPLNDLIRSKPRP